MSITIGNSIINGASAELNIINNKTIKYHSSGIISNPNQVSFYATSTVGTVTMPAGWNILRINSAVINNGSCFNTSTYAFTAPVDGVYTFSGITLLTTNVATSSYIHPMFWVNGGAARNPNTSYHLYRMRHYGMASVGYPDGAIHQIFYLYAGDYVQYIHYNVDASFSNYYYYSQFSGALIG